MNLACLCNEHIIKASLNKNSLGYRSRSKLHVGESGAQLRLKIVFPEMEPLLSEFLIPDLDFDLIKVKL